MALGQDPGTAPLTAKQIADIDTILGGTVGTSLGSRLGTSPFVQMGLVGATVVLTPQQSGGIFFNNSTSGTPKWTLPALQAGLTYTFVTTSTTNGVVINASDAAQIHAKTNAAGTAITSTASTGTIVNTQGTAVVGDFLTLYCDGTTWWMVSQSGIFAAT